MPVFRASPICHRFSDGEEATRQFAELAIRDVTPDVVRRGVKGPQAADWIAGCDLTVPSDIYGTAAFGADGLIARLGGDEFLLEAPATEPRVMEIDDRLKELPPGIYPMERAEATFLLAGGRAADVLAQTCALDFSQVPVERVLFTRIAATSAAILPHAGDTPCFRIWIDASLAEYLWHTLEEIGQSVA